MKKTSMSKFNLNKSKLRCYEYRKRILKYQKSLLYILGAFSCLEILDYIYHHLISQKKQKRFIYFIQRTQCYSSVCTP